MSSYSAYRMGKNVVARPDEHDVLERGRDMELASLPPSTPCKNTRISYLEDSVLVRQEVLAATIANMKHILQEGSAYFQAALSMLDP